MKPKRIKCYAIEGENGDYYIVGARKAKLPWNLYAFQTEIMLTWAEARRIAAANRTNKWMRKVCVRALTNELV